MMNRKGKKSLSTELRHRVKIQTLTDTADGEGGFTQAWATASTVWAAIYPMRAQQVADYKSIDVDADFLIKVRGDVSVAETQQIVYDSRTFEVLTVENAQERDVVKYVACKERR